MKKNKKILLISVPTGAGHTRAAQAIKKTADAKYPHLTVEHIDMMDFVSMGMKKSVVDSYDMMAKQMPELWGLFYKKTDGPKVSHYVRKFGGLFNSANAGKFFKYIKKYNPDHILCTHFLPIHALNSSAAKHGITASVSILMTDYHSHNLQLSPNISKYFVSTEKMKWRLTHADIPEKKVVVSGIPIDLEFYKKKSLDALKIKYGINGDSKNILILSGGQGLVDIDKIIHSLFESKKSLNIYAIAGNNEKLKNKLDKLTSPPNITLHTIGWTDKIDEYMRVCDVVITKPGGLTTTECMMLERPLIAISPIPGQEEYNAEYILEQGFGVVARSPEDLTYYIENDFEKSLPIGHKKSKQKMTSADIIIRKISE